MKKITIAILLCGISSLIFAQNLPNVGFENWGTEFLYEGLDQWKNSNSEGSSSMLGILKSTDAYSGDYSVKLQPILQDEDTIFNFVYHGTVTEGPTGGMAYSEVFDQVKGVYKCNMPEEDSATIYIIKWYGSSPVQQISKVGGVHETWTEFTVDVVGGICDSVFIGFVSSDIVIETNVEFDSWVMFDSIYFNNTLGDNPSAIPNHDMEDWIDYEALTLIDWHTVNGFLYAMGLEAVSQSENAYAGIYSAMLQGHSIYGHEIPGYLSIGEITFDDEDPILGVPYNYQPTYLTGYYKYIPEGGDNAVVILEMRASGVTIGGNTQGLAAALEWTYFVMPIDCSTTPDEMELVFSTGSNVNSILYLDEVNLDFNTSSKDNKANKISIYPNPASDYIIVNLNGNSEQNINIYDLQGRLVITSKINNSTSKIDISALDSEIYFVRFSEKTSDITKLRTTAP